MEEIEVEPPQIWTFDECAAVNTDGIKIDKEYKPQGAFYLDANLLCKLYGIRPHPIFQEPQGAQPDEGEVGGFDDQKRAKEPTSINLMRYRLDPNSMKVLFKVLETCPHITTIKFQNTGMTVSMMNKIVSYINTDNCPIVNAFFDWNPILTDEFKPGMK